MSRLVVLGHCHNAIREVRHDEMTSAKIFESYRGVWHGKCCEPETARIHPAPRQDAIKWRVCGPNTKVSYSGWKPARQTRDLESSQRTQHGKLLWRGEAQFPYQQWDPRIASTKEAGWSI